MEQLSRITPATADTLAALMAAGEATWGLQLIKNTGRPAGSIYPILDRLENLGWVTSKWEEDSNRKGPRRRLYQLTTDGAKAAPDVVQAAKRREQKKASRGTSPVFGRSVWT